MQFRARDGASPPSDVEEQDAAAALLERLDGTRSVEEVVELFADQRLLAHNLLARFVRDRFARPVDAGELLQLAHALEADEPARVRTLVQRALDAEKAQYADVLAIWQRVRREHPLAVTSWFELPREIAELEAPKAEVDAFPSNGR